jgi:hypothetical protein
VKPDFNSALEGMADIAVYHAKHGTRPDVVEGVKNNFESWLLLPQNSETRKKQIQQQLKRITDSEKGG